jgi:hypothetical protein
MIDRTLQRLAPTPWNLKPLSTARAVRVRDCNDKTLFLCDDPVLAQAIIDMVNDHDAVIERIERLQEIALLLRDRLREQAAQPRDRWTDGEDEPER